MLAPRANCQPDSTDDVLNSFFGHSLGFLGGKFGCGEEGGGRIGFGRRQLSSLSISTLTPFIIVPCIRVWASCQTGQRMSRFLKKLIMMPKVRAKKIQGGGYT